MGEQVRIAVIDDHPLMREGVVSVLASEEGFSVVGEGSSGPEAIAIAEQLLPDVLLLDVSIPGGGIDAARAVSQSCPFITVVMLTVAEDEETVTSALQAGARGYILKGISGNELVSTIWRMHRGESYISPHLAARLLAQMAPSNGSSPPETPSLLTAREAQILSRVVAGQAYDEIGREFGLAESTIKNQMTNVLQKLHSRGRGGSGKN